MATRRPTVEVSLSLADFGVDAPASSGGRGRGGRRERPLSAGSSSSRNSSRSGQQAQHPATPDNHREAQSLLQAGGGRGGRRRPSPKAAGFAQQTPPPAAAGLPSHKVGRVKVGVRCRPPFEDEVHSEGYQSVLITLPDAPLPKVQLLLDSQGKPREFFFDYVFGPASLQDAVYSTVGSPIVEDVLRGFNGTILAYGQTGTGKTFTMGILERVRDETAGIIPRALGHLFGHIADHPDRDITVSMSFLQIYLETIQDLLSPAAGERWDANLAIREDPARGFYVEGLHEYIVRNYEEAEAIVNLGLENRAMAPTLMNTTSSRSHTVLTVMVEQKQKAADSTDEEVTYSRTLRSKLLMVDLAGSERVRRTTSKGTRLSEAKSINTSLSALGNVIAALADPNATHVPFRDSKLTRLLQDSLGGTANTTLVATVGPASYNASETLSTLQFAARCMHIESHPVLHEEVDYAEMCARMQSQLAGMEREFMQRQSAAQEQYETVIRELSSQVAQLQSESFSKAAGAGRVETDAPAGVQALIQSNAEQMKAAGDWLRPGPESSQLVVLLSVCYQLLCHAADASALPLRDNIARASKLVREQQRELEAARRHDKERSDNVNAMQAEDGVSPEGLGPHLAPISQVEARTRVESRFISNNLPLTATATEQHEVDGGAPVREHPPLESFETPMALIQYLNALQGDMDGNGQRLTELLQVKDGHYRNVKGELVAQTIERRQREEEVVNWSYVLKYLLATTSRLRRQLRTETQVNSLRVGSPTSPHPPPQLQSPPPPAVSAADASPALTPVQAVRLREQRRDPDSSGKLGRRLARGMVAANDREKTATMAAAEAFVKDAGAGRPPPKRRGSKSSAAIPEPAQALLKRVRGMSREQIMALPPAQRNGVLQVRLQLGIDDGIPITATPALEEPAGSGSVSGDEPASPGLDTPAAPPPGLNAEERERWLSARANAVPRSFRVYKEFFQQQLDSPTGSTDSPPGSPGGFSQLDALDG